MAKLIYRKDTIGGIDVDIALQGTTLRLNDIKVSNLAGARLAVRGSVANYQSAMPRPDIAFNFGRPTWAVSSNSPAPRRRPAPAL